MPDVHGPPARPYHRAEGVEGKIPGRALQRDRDVLNCTFEVIMAIDS